MSEYIHLSINLIKTWFLIQYHPSLHLFGMKLGSSAVVWCTVIRGLTKELTDAPSRYITPPQTLVPEPHWNVGTKLGPAD